MRSRTFSRIAVLCAVFCLSSVITAFAQVQLTATTPVSGSPGSMVIVAGNGYPSGTISASKVTVTLTPPSGSPATVTAMAVTGTGATRTVFFKVPTSLIAQSPKLYSVAVSGTTSTNVPFATATPASFTVNPLPYIASMTPAVGINGTAFTVQIAGAYTAFAATSKVIVDPVNSTTASGITVSNVVINSPKLITAKFTVAADAVPGPRTVRVTTGTENAPYCQVASPVAGQCLSGAFNLFASTALSFASISPSAGTQGQSLDVAVVGSNTHFAQGTTIANFGNGITLNTLTIKDETHATANITVSATTPLGGREITLVTGGEYARSGAQGFNVTASSAALSSISVATGSQGDNLTGIIITGTGTNFLQNATQLSFGGGINVGNAQVISPTQIRANISVTASATPGVHAVTATTGGEVARGVSFTVTQSTPLLTDVSPSSGQQGQTLTVNFTGANLDFVKNPPTVEFGSNIKVNSLTVNSATSASANITIDLVAGSGGRRAVLTSGTTNFPFNFSVTASPAAIVGVSPASGPQGTVLSVTVTGANTHWDQSTTTASFGPTWPCSRVEVNRITIQSPTKAVLDLNIPATACTGAQGFNLTTGGERVDASFTVTANTPTLTVSPSSGMPGSKRTVNFTGQFTHFDGSTQAVIDGQGVTLENFHVTSAASATATLTIDPKAVLGARNITFTTGSAASGAEIVKTQFSVVSTPAYLLHINPYYALHGSTLNVEITGVYTHFAQGSTTLGFGPDVTVNSLVVKSPGSLVANISIADDAALGWRDAYVNTGAEQLTIGFRIDGPNPAVVSDVLPASGSQGQTMVITIQGRNTHWDDTTQAIVGAGVTVSDLVINGPTLATASISISPTAPVGGNSVIMVTGSEVASGRGFTVTPGAAQLRSATPVAGAVSITQVQVDGSGKLTLTGNNSFPAGSSLFLSGFTNATWLNGQIVKVSGATPASITVAASPYAAYPAAADTGTAVSAQLVAAQNQTLWVNLVGQGTHWLKGETVADFGGGIMVDQLIINDATHASAQITVLSQAAVGFRPVTLVTDSEYATLQQALDVQQGTPALLSSFPNSAQQGVTMNVQVLGRFTHWQQGVTTAFYGSQNVAAPPQPITSATVSGAGQILPSIAGTAGQTCKLTFTDPSGSGGTASVALTADNTIASGTAVTITNGGAYTWAPTVAQLSSGTATCSGSLTLSTVLKSKADLFIDNNVRVNSFTVQDSTTAVMNVTVSPVADVDYSCTGRPLTVTTGSEQVTLPYQFCVQRGPAMLTGVSPAVGKQGQTMTINVTGYMTHFLSALPTAEFGDGGVQTTRVTAIDDTHASFDVAVTSNARVGYHTVTIRTQGEVAQAENVFRVAPGMPTLNQVGPVSGQQGETLEVQILGQYTHFNSESTLTVGQGITLNSFTVIDAQTAHASLTIDPLAFTGGRTFTVTTPNLQCTVLADELCVPGQQVGSEIVAGNLFSVVPGPAIITQVTPAGGNQGQHIVVNVTGEKTHWEQGLTQLSIAGAGSDITVHTFVVNSPTSATSEITFSPTAGLGPRSLAMHTAGESTVHQGALVITGGIPSLTWVSPNSSPRVNTNDVGEQSPVTSLNVQINGVYTKWASGDAPLVDFGSGITVKELKVNSETSLTAVVDVDPATAYGWRTVVVTGTVTAIVDPDKPATEVTRALTSSFNVVPPPTPYIQWVNPGAAVPGQTLSINLAGHYTHWLAGDINAATIDFGTGIKVNSFQITGNSSARANITVAPDAAAGGRKVTLTDGNGDALTTSFNVFLTTPTIAVVDPGSAMQGTQNKDVNVVGRYTAFDDNTVFNFGTGVTVNSVTVLGPTIATVNISVDQMAAQGGRSVTATMVGQGGQVISGGGFSVTASMATIQSVSPNTAKQGDTLADIEVTGAYTHWDSTTRFAFGGGISVTNVEVTSPTSAKLSIKIDPLAWIGIYSLNAVTRGEVSSISNAFVVQPGTPIILSSGPGSAPQQGDVKFTILGQVTDWQQDVTSISLGEGVVITAVPPVTKAISVTSPTSITATGYVTATTYPGCRTLTVTTNTQVLTRSCAFYVTPGPAAVSGLAPAQASQGDKNIDIQVSGTNTNFLQGATTANFGQGVAVNSVTVISPTLATVNVSINPNAAVQLNSVTMTTLGETAHGTSIFTVKAATPVMQYVNPSSLVQGQTGDVLINTLFTHYSAANLPQMDFGSGITVNSVTAVSDISARANITVSPIAATGTRTVTATTATETVAGNSLFSVKAGVAKLAAIGGGVQASGKQNQSGLQLQLTGSNTHFTMATPTASFGPGVTVTDLQVLGDTSLIATVSIGQSAPIQVNDVTITTGGEVATLTGGFRVLVGAPFVRTVTPATGHQGDSTLAVNLTGLYTNFVDGVSTVSFGAGVTVNSLQVTGATTATANISIDAAATTGSRNVTVTTNGEVATIAGGFTVLAGQPHLLSAGPASTQAGGTVNVVLNGMFTHFQQGTTSVSFGSGITTNSVTVNGPEQLTANITLAPATSVGGRDITVTTNGEVVSLSSGFTVLAGVPAITQINSNIGAANSTATVYISGRFTNWVHGTTTASFGPGISVGGNPSGTAGPVTVNNSGYLTAVISIDASAVLGPRDVVVTTNGEVETVAGGFTVQPTTVAPPSVISLSPSANSAGIPINSNFIVVFSQPMDRNTITSSNVRLYMTSNPGVGWYQIPANYSLDAAGRVLTVAPNSVLAVASDYYLQLTNEVKDASGNRLNSYATYLSTSFDARTTAPKVTAVNPAPALTGVGTNVIIQVQFDSLMDKTTQSGLTVSDGATNVPGSLNWNSNSVLFFTPAQALQPNHTYTVSYDAPLADTVGNLVQAGSFSFTTGAGANTARNSTSLNFTNWQSGVGTNFAPRVNFSRPVNPLSINTGTLLLYNYDSGKYVHGTVKLAADARSATFTPSVALLPDTYYRVHMSGGSYDMDGNYLDGIDGYFTTDDSIDTTAPQVISVSPSDGSASVPLNARVVVSSNEPIDPASWDQSSIQVVDNGGVAVKGTVSQSDDHTLIFTPAGVSIPLNSYLGCWNDNGNRMLNGYNYSSGSMTVESCTATCNAKGFNYAGLQAGSYCFCGNNYKGAGQGNACNYSCSGNSSQTCGGSWANSVYASGPNAGTNAFPSGVTYTVKVADFGDEAGNTVVPFTSQFTTGSTSVNDGLSLSGISPASGATNVSGTQSITLTFNHPLDPSTVGTDTLMVMNGWNSNYGLAGQYQVNGNQVTFTPTSPFPAGARIYVGSCNGPTDVAGNSINGCWNQLAHFDVSSSAPVTPLAPFQVTAFSPADGATNVGLRAPVVATFNRSLNPGSLDTSDNNGNLALFQGDNLWCRSYNKSQDNTTLSFNCGIMPSSATMTALLTSGIQDMSGNPLTNFRSQFSTTYYDSNWSGSVISARPGSGSGGISVNSPLVLFTNAPVNPSTASAGLRVAQNNATITGSVQVLDNGYTLQFTPDSPYQPGALIQWWVTGDLLDTLYGASFNSKNGYFRVVADTSTTVPAVQVLSSPNGSTIAPNAKFSVQFNTALDPATVSSSTIYLRDNGTGKTVQATYTMPAPNVVHIEPQANLSSSSSVYLYVNSGLHSSTSVPAGNNSWHFYTSASADTTVPTIVSAVPYDGSSTVGINVSPGVVFSKPVDPVTVNSASFQVLNGGTPLVGSYWISSDDTRIEFVPNAPLPGNANLTMVINGVTDRVGHTISFSSQFKTANGPDFSTPSVVWTSIPRDGNVPRNGMLTVRFSESMDVTTFNSSNIQIQDTLLNWQTVPATLSWSPDQSTAYLTPSAPLAAGRQYYLRVQSGTDLAGNTVDNIGYYFTADYTSSTTAPTVANINPQDGATGIGVNGVIQVQFTAPVDPNTVSNAALMLGGAKVATTPVLSSGNTILQLVPQVPLLGGTTYQFTITGIKDPAGNTVPTVSSTFTTAASFDFSHPRVINYTPANNASVGTNVSPKLVFNKPLNPMTVSNNTFRMYSTEIGKWMPLTVTLSPDRLSVTLTPQINLLPNTRYRYQACCSYQDANGNNGDGIDLYFYTSDGTDTAGPIVTLSPVPGATGVPANTKVVASVNKPIDATSWSQSSLQVVDSSNFLVAGTVSQPDNQTLVFTPTSNLAAGIYTVNVSGFKDGNGNAVVPYTSQFTTVGSVATGSLQLVSSDPAWNWTNVASMQPITLTFNRAINPQTVSPDTLRVMNTWNSGLGLSGTYAVNGNQVIFTPSSPYPAGAKIYVGACNGPSDLLGNSISGCWNQLAYFTVSGTSSDTTPLQVISVNPPDGTTGVRRNATVAITFNKSIRPSSASDNVLLYVNNSLQNRGSFSMSADNRTLYFNNGSLYAGANYTIELAPGTISDMSGNTLSAGLVSRFTTASDPSTGNGSVTRVSPKANATGVSTNTWVTLYVDRPVNASTLPGNFRVTVNGENYAGTVVPDASGYELQFKPALPFPNGATVQWWFSGVRDIDGNDYNGNSGVFYTAGQTDLGAAPQVVAVSPATGVSNAPTNTRFHIQYSLPIDAGTLAGNVYMQGVPSTVTLVTPTLVRLVPQAPLNANSGWYYVCANGSVKGTNGKAAQSSCWASYIQTGSGPDTSAGTVTIGPPNGSVNVGTNAYLRIGFSKPVDSTSVNTGTVQVSSGGTPIEGTFSFSISNNDVVAAYFTPVNPLPASSVIQVNVNGAQDYAGNTFTGATAQFTTAARPDFSRASVGMSFPHWATVGTNATFSCRYSKPMDPASITSAGTYLRTSSSDARIPVDYIFSSDLMSVTMKPKQELPAGSQYYYYCYSAIDLTGNSQDNEYRGFYTASGPDTTGPALVSVNPPNGATNVSLNTNQGDWCGSSLKLQFDQPVIESTLGNITLTPAGGSPMSIGFCPFNGNTATGVSLPYTLQPNTTYTFNISGVADYSGNTITPVTSSFTTGSGFDWSQPSATALTPAANAQNVPLNVQPSITFSEIMDPVLIDTSHVLLKEHNTGTTVPGTLTFSPDYRTVYFSPSSSLKPGTIYDFGYKQVNWWMKDMAGNSINTGEKWTSFTTTP